MRTTKQILRKLKEEKMLIKILREQLLEHDGPAGVYRDVSEFLLDSILDLENAIEELDSIAEYEGEETLGDYLARKEGTNYD